MKSKEKIVITVVAGAVTIAAILATHDNAAVVVFIIGLLYLWH